MFFYVRIILHMRSERNFDLTEPQRESLRQVLSWTIAYFDRVPEGIHIGGHGFDKTMRQAGMAAVIAHGEGHPIFLPVLTAMVMDVGRATRDPRSRDYRHGELSREMVETDLFPSLDILTPEDKIVVGNAVEDHSKLNENVRRSYVVEAAMDADRLDCLGALGPLRVAAWRPNIPLILPGETDTRSGDTQIQTVFQDMAVRHMEWVDMLWTETARSIAIPRVLAYREYLERLQQEASFAYDAYRELGFQ